MFLWKAAIYCRVGKRLGPVAVLTLGGPHHVVRLARISKHEKPRVGSTWLEIVSLNMFGSAVDALGARLRLVPLLYQDASVIRGLLDERRGAFSAANHSCLDGFL